MFSLSTIIAQQKLVPHSGRDPVIPLIASGIVGMAILLFIRWLLLTLAVDEEEDQEWRYDYNRMKTLKQISLVYRFLSPLMHFLARLNRRLFREQLPSIGREILIAGHSRYWLAEEYLARMEIIGFILFPVYLLVCYQWMGTAGTITAGLLILLTVWFQRRQLTGQAQRRLTQIKRQFPFLLDLLTLQMEAGATFLNALSEAVQEYQHHPVGEEFGRVLGELNMGKSRQESLGILQQRLQDDEINSIICSILQGETLGTPLVSLFRTQADLLRLKRSQRAETIAGEAGVQMLLPGILVMMATIIVILGPFVISFLYSDLF